MYRNHCLHVYSKYLTPDFHHDIQSLTSFTMILFCVPTFMVRFSSTLAKIRCSNWDFYVKAHETRPRNTDLEIVEKDKGM